MNHVLTIDWLALERSYSVSQCCWHWVSSESIRKCLKREHFDDLSRPWDHTTHHAARIATIVRMMEEGVEFHPLKLELSRREGHLHDGHHRLRSYQFRRALQAVRVEIWVR